MMLKTSVLALRCELKTVAFSIFSIPAWAFVLPWLLTNSHSVHSIVLLHECSLQRADYCPIIWPTRSTFLPFLQETEEGNISQPKSLIFLFCVKKLGLASPVAKKPFGESAVYNKTHIGCKCIFFLSGHDTDSLLHKPKPGSGEDDHIRNNDVVTEKSATSLPRSLLICCDSQLAWSTG